MKGIEKIKRGRVEKYVENYYSHRIRHIGNGGSDIRGGMDETTVIDLWKHRLWCYPTK